MSVHLYYHPSQDRENEFIDRFFTRSAIDLHLANILNVSSDWAAYCIRIPFSYILPNTEKQGDIDVCILPIANKCLHNVTLVDLSFERVVAIEIKTMLYNKNKELFSRKFSLQNISQPDKKQHKIRRQVIKLCELGFNDVCLLYILISEPIDIQYGNIMDWINAGDFVVAGLDKYRNQIRSDDNDRFTTMSLNIGSMGHKPENMAGTIITHVFNKPQVNSTLDRRNKFRIALEEKIGNLFPFQVQGTNIPLIIRACSDYKCQNLYVYSIRHDINCPRCGAKPH